MFIKSLARQTVLLQLLLHFQTFASSFSWVDIAGTFVRQRTLAKGITAIMRFLNPFCRGNDILSELRLHGLREVDRHLGKQLCLLLLCVILPLWYLPRLHPVRIHLK